MQIRYNKKLQNITPMLWYIITKQKINRNSKIQFVGDKQCKMQSSKCKILGGLRPHPFV